jgi:hypothetical protein
VTDHEDAATKGERTAADLTIPRFALIVGAMKAGTTTLFMLLVQHPEICRSRKKEPHFFSSEEPLNPSDYYGLWDFDPDVHKWALEASTSYTKFRTRVPGTAERIAEFPGEFRCIYMLRDPVDRIESHVAHNVSKKHYSSLRDDGVQVSPHQIAPSKYATQLDRLRSVMPDVPILLLDMMDLKTPEGMLDVARRCAEFLEIDPSFPFKAIPPRNVRRSDGRTSEVVLSTAQREELREILREDVERLRSHYGFDTSGWSGFE